jgi:ABC-type sulfate/molybdate transport systems ATPase subunit
VHRLTDREQATVLLTTHDLAEAEKLADRVLILAGGRIIACRPYCGGWRGASPGRGCAARRERAMLRAT